MLRTTLDTHPLGVREHPADDEARQMLVSRDENGSRGDQQNASAFEDTPMHAFTTNLNEEDANLRHMAAHA